MTSTCFICLEETTPGDLASPLNCECYKMPLHVECAVRFRYNSSPHCSICKSQIPHAWYFFHQLTKLVIRILDDLPTDEILFERALDDMFLSWFQVNPKADSVLSITSARWWRRNLCCIGRDMEDEEDERYVHKIASPPVFPKELAIPIFLELMHQLHIKGREKSRIGYDGRYFEAGQIDRPYQGSPFSHVMIVKEGKGQFCFYSNIRGSSTYCRYHLYYSF